MPKGHLALHLKEVDLDLVEGKVPLDEQSLHPGDLALVPLDGGVPLLGFKDEVTDPLLQGGNLFPSFPSLGRKIGALPPKFGGYLAHPREFPLGRFPSSLLVLSGHLGVPLPVEEFRFL